MATNVQHVPHMPSGCCVANDRRDQLRVPHKLSLAMLDQTDRQAILKGWHFLWCMLSLAMSTMASIPILRILECQDRLGQQKQSRLARDSVATRERLQNKSHQTVFSDQLRGQIPLLRFRHSLLRFRHMTRKKSAAQTHHLSGDALSLWGHGNQLAFSPAIGC
ncbi:hypothetical protein LZ32DRAFT_398414 [Colletotrichum eremochloae]|nr:hypothetical protein LZ32DRAFT_398414 [Colletotrichum eremochloae]